MSFPMEEINGVFTSGTQVLLPIELTGFAREIQFECHCTFRRQHLTGLTYRQYLTGFWYRAYSN